MGLPVLLSGKQAFNYGGPNLHWQKRQCGTRQFRFRGGPPFKRLGELALPVTIPNGRTSDGLNHILYFGVDVVAAVIPLLISQQAITNMKGIMDFATFTLEIPDRYTIQLQKS